jgi:hypothetical protein
MTHNEAIACQENRTRVCAGKGVDYDEGIIIDVDDDETAVIAWDSGVRTPCAIAELSMV